MALPEDVVVARDQGARVQQPFLSGVLKIGVIGRSRGKNTDETITITRQATGQDELKDYTSLVYAIDPIRAVDKAIDLETGEGEVYYPNIHFNVIKQSDNSILDPNNLGDNEISSALRLDWSVAPPLVAPGIVNKELVSSSTGGFEAATTAYYAVAVVDHNGVESSVGPISKVEMSDPDPLFWQVNLAWRMVEYAIGYKLYRGTMADGSDLAKIQDLIGKGNVSYLDADIVGSGSPQTINLTASKPKTDDTYDLYYKYGSVTRNAIKEFTTDGEAKEEHGVGSELSNVAKLYMNQLYNNAPILVTVVPESDTYAGYLEAAQKFATYHVNFIVVLYAGSTSLSTFITNMTPFYNLAASLSDEKVGQKEGYLAFSLPYKAGWTTADVRTTCAAFTSTATHGKRGFLVIPDGFKIAVSTWELPSGTSQSEYYVTDPEDVDITPIVFAGAAMARYCGLRDTAEPLTEKDIVGFTFEADNFTATEIKVMREAGGMVVENNTGIAVVNQSINMAQPGQGIEDGEMNICVTEDWIKKDMRARIRKYRGMKMLGDVLEAAKDTIIDALNQYIDNYKIRYYDPATVQVYQDPNQKDRMLGSFIYMPVYPINKIAISYKFTFVANL